MSPTTKLKHSQGKDARLIREVSDLDWLDMTYGSALETDTEIEEITQWNLQSQFLE